MKTGYLKAFAATMCLCLSAGTVHAAQKALLIGAGVYPYLEPDAQLSGPANDVRQMADFLKGDWGFASSDVRILVEEGAAKNNILGSITGWLASETKPGDRVIIYYSGHGSQVPDRNGDEEDGLDETFVPTDYGRRGARAEDMLTDDEIASALSTLKGREVILIADSVIQVRSTAMSCRILFPRVLMRKRVTCRFRAFPGPCRWCVTKSLWHAKPMCI